MARKNQPRTELGTALREARERLRYSQDALGDELAVSGTIISRWELGRVRPPIESLARFADLAGATDEERDALYGRWILLAGYRTLREPQGATAPPAAAPDPHAQTVEGAMGRAIIDQVADPARRLDLVLRMREWVLQLPEAGEGSAPEPETRPSQQASREPHGALLLPGTLTPAG